MKIIQPSRDTFWRAVFLTSAALPFLSIWQSIALAQSLEIDICARTSWMGLLAGFFVLGFIPLLAWTLTWFNFKERILFLAESPVRLIRNRWTGWILLIISIIGYTTTFAYPPLRALFGGEGWIRFLGLWYFALIGLMAVKILWHDADWFTSLLAVVLVQTTFHLLVVNFSGITDYPFSMGWSETSRYYYPSLYLSIFVYGQEYPWPILHPTLHILLAPPYLVNAPLWAHRLWQVLIRLVLVGAIVPTVLKRLSIQGKTSQWLAALGILLYLFMGPLYFHLAIPVLIILHGFSSQDDRRTWFVVLLASIWCGWSRVNWFPVPGMFAAVLYLLEMPFKGRNVWGYLLKPALWFIAGTLTAFVSQRIYIAVSGVPPEVFYTSLSSDLLWYRLLPNSSYFLGILPSAILASLSMWLVIYISLRGRRVGLHPIRLFFVFAALLVLFLGGLVVSLKIGGGADLHNMDAYWVLLLIVTGYLMSARYFNEDGELEQPVPLHWTVIVFLIAMPVWSQLKSNVGFKTYDLQRTQSVLYALQERVDEANRQDGDILFITQRHLISMHMLQGVTLIPEYEREDLMELAMANNVEGLARFQQDLEDHRFSLIVVDPLNYSIYSRRRGFSDENNVWVRRVMKSILCNYRMNEVFPGDEIALYVPQEGERQCPQ